MRTILRAALAAALLALPLAGPAQAAEYYRFWSFFTVEGGEFVASQEGVGAVVPEDGSTIGFRYAASASMEDVNVPRADLAEIDFDALCGEVEPADGQKRVGVLVDPGVSEDATDTATPPAPTGECAQVPADASALQVLQAVGEVRTESSDFGPLLCAIDGYPATGCTETVQTATPADDGPVEFQIMTASDGASEAATPSGSGAENETTEVAADGTDGSTIAVWVAVGVALLAAIGGGAYAAKRRSDS